MTLFSLLSNQAVCMMSENHEQLQGTKYSIHSSNLRTFDELPSGNFFKSAFLPTIKLFDHIMTFCLIHKMLMITKLFPLFPTQNS